MNVLVFLAFCIINPKRLFPLNFFLAGAEELAQ
jgi:hypothetical protein